MSDNLVPVSLTVTPSWWGTASNTDRAAALDRLLALGAFQVNATDSSLEVTVRIPEDLALGFQEARDRIRERIQAILLPLN